MSGSSFRAPLSLYRVNDQNALLVAIRRFPGVHPAGAMMKPRRQATRRRVRRLGPERGISGLVGEA